MSKKHFILDTSVCLEETNCIEILRNHEENEIFIPLEVLEELDALKKTNKSYLVREFVTNLIKYKNYITILRASKQKNNDNQILFEILSNLDKIPEPRIFVTNDKILSFKAFTLGIDTEELKSSIPYKSESEKYTGFVDVNKGENLIQNCFYWNEGKLFYNKQGKEKAIDYENKIWDLNPKTPYQNAAMELLLDKKIFITSIASAAGFGKSSLAIAAAIHLTQQEKKYKKIYVFKHHLEVGGEELGFLPGSVDEKISPYFKPIMNIIEKLHGIRECNRLFIDPRAPELQLNKRKIEFIPLNYCRGIEFSDCIVVCDEIQNFTRQDIKTIYSRCGENVKVIVTGDVEQCDNPHCNRENNGMSWTTKAFKNNENYGHIVLRGKNSRGPIADMTRNSIL